MVTYHNKRKKSVGPRVIGLLVFLLALSVTFADVYGLNSYDYTKPNGQNTPVYTYDSAEEYQNFSGEELPPSNPSSTPASGVPEPATLTLLGIGLSALALRRLKK